MKCQICRKDKLCFFANTEDDATTIACVECANEWGMRLIEEVLEKEVRDGNEGVEEEDSRKGLL